MCRIFTEFPKIKWFSGATFTINESSVIIKNPLFQLYNSTLLREGFYNPRNYVLSQEGTFWRPELWEKAGGIGTDLKLAGDFYLWTRFAEYEELYTINTFLSCFRRHGSQLSANSDAYLAECDRFIRSSIKAKMLSIFFKYWKKYPMIFRLYPYLFNLEHNLIHIEQERLSIKKYRYFICVDN